MVAVWHWITVATSVNQGVKRVLKGWQICEICGLACHFQSIESRKVNFSRRRTDQEAQHRWFLGGRHGGMAKKLAGDFQCMDLHRTSIESIVRCIFEAQLHGDCAAAASVWLETTSIFVSCSTWKFRRFRWSSFSCDFPKYIKIHQNSYESLQCNCSFLAEEEHSTSRFEEAEVHQVHRSESHHQGGWRWFFGCMKDMDMYRDVSICTACCLNGSLVGCWHINMMDVGSF